MTQETNMKRAILALLALAALTAAQSNGDLQREAPPAHPVQ